MTSTSEMQRQHYALQRQFETLEQEKDYIIRKHLEEIKPEIDKIDRKIKRIGDRMDILYEKIMNDLLKSGDLDY